MTLRNHGVAAVVFLFLILAQRTDHKVQQVDLEPATQQRHVFNDAANDASKVVCDFRGGLVRRDVTRDIVSSLHQHFQKLVPEVFEVWNNAEDRDVAEPF